MGRVLLIEFNDKDDAAFDEIMAMLKSYSDFSIMQINDNSTLSFPMLVINFKQRKVYSGHKEINLTAKEYDILCLLAINKGLTLTYKTIYEKIWKENVLNDIDNTVGCHVRSLRRKLNKAVLDAPFKIRCVRSVGYSFEINKDA